MNGAEKKPPALFLRPHIFFPTLLALIAISVLLTPQVETSEGAPELTTHSVAATGARGFSETLKNLGWRVSQLEEPLTRTTDTNAVYAVLVPSDALSEAEAHTLLERVRAGASAFIIAGGGALADSLHIDRSAQSGVLSYDPGDSVKCATTPRTLTALPTRFPLVVYSVRPTGPLKYDTVHIGVLRNLVRRDSLHRAAAPAALGLSVGRGRIVAIGDGRILMNDVFRVCHWGAAVVSVRAMEWLSARDGAPPIKNIMFDEFHQGYGRHASVMRAIYTWLTATSPGRTAAQLAIAALLLLAALSPRPIAPLPRQSIPRRSPLEHVTALAQAYEQVKGTRTAARLLVQGVRRRAAPSTGARHTTEEQFLAAVATRNPALRDDTERARKAMIETVSPAELLELANTIDRIERSVRP